MTTATPTKSFADLGVEPTIVEALSDAGISTPFPIQEMTLPLALTGADIIGQARTGTGKTLAFGIPILARIDADSSGVQALAIVPTRELCLQVTGDLNQAGVRKGIDVAAVYGGRAMEPQIEAIEGGAQVVVGTPGRLLDMMRRGHLDLSGVQALVLDEADEMLDLGFLPDVERLIEATAAQRQTLLFSATMPSAVVGLARRYMDKPTFLRAEVEEVRIAPETTQHFFSCHRMDKPAVIARILETPHRGLTVIFSRTKRMCDILAEELRSRGIKAAPIHSDLRQEARERALQRFRDGQTTVLVATEVAARGLDIDDVTHVVNYDCPDDEKMYLHRIGRTGRAGAAGVAITLALWNELARLEMIKRALDIEAETHEVFSTSEILDELFELPPRAARRPVAADDEEPEERPARKERSSQGRVGKRQERGGGRGRGGRGRGRDGDTDRGGDTDRNETSSAPKAEASTDAHSTDAQPSGGQSPTAGSSDAGTSDVGSSDGRADDADDDTYADGGPTRTRARQRTRRVAEVDGETVERTTSSAPSPSAEDDGDGDGGKGRQRTRPRRGGDRRGSTADAASSNGTPSAKGDDDAEGDQQATVRTRTRARRRGGDSSEEPAPSGDAARGARDEQQEGAQSRGREGRGGRQGGQGGGRGEQSERGSRQGRGGRGRGDRQSQGERAKSDDGGGRTGRSGDDRDDSRRRGGDQSRRSRKPDVSSDEARGAGRPRLRRPLDIEHLP